MLDGYKGVKSPELSMNATGLAMSTVASEKNRDMLFIGNVFYKQ